MLQGRMTLQNSYVGAFVNNRIWQRKVASLMAHQVQYVCHLPSCPGTPYHPATCVFYRPMHPSITQATGDSFYGVTLTNYSESRRERVKRLPAVRPRRIKTVNIRPKNLCGVQLRQLLRPVCVAQVQSDDDTLSLLRCTRLFAE